jgi:hypothetical protein
MKNVLILRLNLLKIMTGFEIRFNNRTIYASSEYLFMITSQHRGAINLNIIGRNQSEHITWYSDTIDDVDEIIVKVVDVTQNSEPVETVSKDLLRYNNLKKHLKEEKLI